MRLHELQPANGAKHKKKRVGRGPGSGHGSTACRGDNGQNSRSGGGVRIGFEGGQMPLARRLPKRGFNNKTFSTVYVVFNISDIEESFKDKKEIKLEDFYLTGWLKKGEKIKILGDGEFKSAKIIHAHKASASAIEKVQKSGGEIKIISSGK
jgi:large subunit ribosomal protein L15